MVRSSRCPSAFQCRCRFYPLGSRRSPGGKGLYSCLKIPMTEELAKKLKWVLQSDMTEHICTQLPQSTYIILLLYNPPLSLACYFSQQCSSTALKRQYAFLYFLSTLINTLSFQLVKISFGFSTSYGKPG